MRLIVFLSMCFVAAISSTLRAGPVPVISRTVQTLDQHWDIIRLPALAAKKAAPLMTRGELQKLRCPGPSANWKPVQLPDDYIVCGKFNHRAVAGHGSLPVYPAWYRREILIPASASGKTVWLNFGGVYRDAIVFINGRYVGQHPSGYTAFRYNISNLVLYGLPNQLAV